MTRGKEHLDIDLEFLDKNDPNKKNIVEQDNKSVGSASPTEPNKYSWKTILGIGAVVLFFAWAIFSGDNSGNTNTPPTSGGTDPIVNADVTSALTDTSVSDVDTPIIPKAKTDGQICSDNYGSHSYPTGKKNADGGPECGCQDGYTWNSAQTSCVVVPPPPKTNEQICKDMNGPYGIYNSSDNTCGCADGYYYGVISKKCVNIVESRNQSCESSYPGTSFLKYDEPSGKNICDCKAGYDWNNNRTACYTLSSFNQSCVSSYGQGSYSTTENGKRVCDCSYGYSFNIARDACVTTASIDQICEINVGRNSSYTGRVEGGKYICSEPY